MTPRLRLAWFAAVAFVVMFGVGELVRWVLQSVPGPGWWAIDLELVLDAGRRLASGGPIYAAPGFLYPPLAAVAAVPLTGLDPLAVSLAYAGAKVTVAGCAVIVITVGWRRADRALAFLGLVACLPFLHDLFLGNANAFLVGAVAWAVFGSLTPRSGVALGVLAAIFAKPLLVPVFLWLLVFRPRVLTGTVVAGLLATVVGLVATGPDAYIDWLRALMAGSRYAAPFAGNHGVTAIAPELWAPVAAVTLAGLIAVLWRRRSRTGLVWAVTAGILLAPYAGTYAALPIAVALPVLGVASPLFTMVLVAVSPVATTHPLPIYAATILVASLAIRDSGPVGGRLP